MKIKAIVTATASAIALCAAGSVSAIPFEPYDAAGIAAAVKIRMGGATAQDKGLIEVMKRLCTAGTMTRVQGNKQSAILCEADGADSLPIAAGTKLVLWKNSDGGSKTGVKPVSNAEDLPFLNLNMTQALYTAGCTISNPPGYKQYVCGSNISNENKVPDAGISDVEPEQAGFVVATTPTFPSGSNNSLTTSAGPQVIFGAPVSKNFRDALQAAQGKTVGSDTEVNMPSLTHAQISSMLGQGGISRVDRLSSILGNVLTNPADPDATDLIHVCRRAEGSGTLAATRIHLLNFGCKNGVTPVVNPNTATPQGGASAGDVAAPAFPMSTPGVQDRVVEYSGTTGVLACLNKKHADNKFALGMASLETIPGSAYTGDPKWGNDAGNWRYVKISGYAPTLLNTVQSKYTFAYEASYQYRAAANNMAALHVPPLPTGALGGTQKTLFDRIVATNSSGPVIATLNSAFVHPFGASGLLGLPGACTATKPSAAPAGILTSAEVSTNPVNTWTRSGKSCQFPRILCETGLDAATGFGPTIP